MVLIVNYGYPGSPRRCLKRSDLVIRKGSSFTWVVPKIVFGLLYYLIRTGLGRPLGLADASLPPLAVRRMHGRGRS